MKNEDDEMMRRVLIAATIMWALSCVAVLLLKGVL